MGLGLLDEKQPDIGRGREDKGEERQKVREREERKPEGKIRITNKTAVVDSGPMYQPTQSGNIMFFSPALWSAQVCLSYTAPKHFSHVIVHS